MNWNTNTNSIPKLQKILFKVILDERWSHLKEELKEDCSEKIISGYLTGMYDLRFDFMTVKYPYAYKILAWREIN